MSDEKILEIKIKYKGNKYTDIEDVKVALSELLDLFNMLDEGFDYEVKIKKVET